MSNPGPPKKDEFRCYAKARSTGERCNRYHIKGSQYCQYHGGRTATRQIVRIDRLPLFYSKKLKSTLAQAVEESLNSPVVEQLSLLEELALMRGFANEVIVLADAAMFANAKAKDTAILMAIDVLKQVAAMAETAARVDRISKDKVSVHDLNAFVQQLVKIAFDSMPEKYARRFEKRIKEIMMPNTVDDSSKSELMATLLDATEGARIIDDKELAELLDGTG